MVVGLGGFLGWGLGEVGVGKEEEWDWSFRIVFGLKFGVMVRVL